ncbi:unnamed protein product [Thelazia callipaeda]|uniref:Protein kinase domain-containing protein n=1 Tax=Thelazia callipaeda TaxID=103827 RepID=A0A0N5CQK0_THECL|nr:unnamed protein product [Thelazia callipaeda]
MTAVQGIEMQPWYFGFLSRDHIASYLLKPGDWCVRNTGTNDEPILYVITKVDQKNLRELKLVQNKNHKGMNQACFTHSFYSVSGWTLIDKKNRTRRDDKMATYDSITEMLSTESSLCHKVYFSNLDLEYNIDKMNLLHPINRPDYLLNDEKVTITETKLGVGHYAEVLKGILETDTVKRCLNTEEVSTSDKRSTKDIIQAKLAKSQMISEARLLQDLIHENIIKIYGIACNFPPVKMVMEFCPGGSLKTLLTEYKEKIKNEERNIFLLEAAKALRHLQIKGYVHRWDIAARNCLITISGSLKLSDFGLSRRLRDLKKRSNNHEDIAWPIPWMAPETLSKKPKFSTKSDVYAFGVLIYEVYSCGGQPWPDISVVEDIIPLVRKGKIMATPPLLREKSIEKLMHDCWKRRASKRPDFIEIVRRFRAIMRLQQVK